MAEPNSALGQDDIDALLAQMSGTPAPAKPASGSRPAQPPAPAATPAPVSAPEPAQKPADPNAPIGQDDIDALLAQLGGGAETPDAPAAQTAAAAAPTPPAPAKPPAETGPLGQDDIDSLLAQLGGGGNDAAEAPKPAPVAIAAAVPAPAPAPASNGPLSQDDIDAMLNSMGAETTPIGATTAAVSASLSQSDIDSMLGEIDAKPPGPGELTKSKPRPVGLSTDALADLMKKHEGGGSETAPAMIDQNDIDALVSQLAAGGDAAPALEAALKSKEAEIKAIQDGAKSTLPTSVDAVGPDQAPIDATTTAVMPAPDMPNAAQNVAPMLGPIPWVTPRELRGARWLMAAATLMLGGAAATLAMSAGSMRALVEDVRREREARLAPTSSYADDLRAGMARLASDNDIEVSKAELFLGDLKRRQPTHDADIALVLARHFRAKGDHQAAVREYVTLGDSGTVLDDPRIHLEHADCLERIGDIQGAIRQVYGLLAVEDAYSGERDQHGHARSAADRAQGVAAISQAWLILGRLLHQPPTQASATAHHAANTHGSKASSKSSHDAGHSPASHGANDAHAPSGGH